MMRRAPKLKLLYFRRAAWACSSVDISTKPKPFERLVILSMITFALTTTPHAANSSFN